MKQSLIYNFLNDDELLRISNKIKQSEKHTAGEICVSIKDHTKNSTSKKSIKEIAELEFFRLGIQNTRDKTGILIFILLNERKFYILADSGINEKVQQSTWDSIKEEMQNYFLHGNFCKGIIHGVDEVGNILSHHFPIKPDDTNEISNRVIVS